MATNVGCRLVLIAFATIALRGVLDGTDFQSTAKRALMIAVCFWPIGLAVGDLARRLVEDLVHKDVEPVLNNFRQAILDSYRDAQPT